MSDRQHGGAAVRLLALLILCGLAGVIYLARYPLLREAARFWIVQDRIEHADAIIVIGDDNFAGDRASEAAALFRGGWAPQVVASGRMLRPYVSIADFISRDLELRGVPAGAIKRFTQRAEDTREEAEALKVLVAEEGWHRILVVTSSYHTRRARYIFRKVMPGGVNVDVVGASDPQFDSANWWESRQARKTFFLETVGYIVAMWELRNEGSAPSAKGDLTGAFKYSFGPSFPAFC